MNWPGLERWQRLWKAIAASGDASPWHEALTRAYAEPHRHYHNQRHISDCLAEFDSARQLASQADAVELALWFHDAVYDPKAADNEEQSAALAKRCLHFAGHPAIGETVAVLVLATKSHQTGGNSDAALLVDIDLSILGQDKMRFDEYEAGIRAEYSWVPKEVFNTKRAEILQGFLNRKRIYATPHFATKYESQARKNLERSIQRLR